MNTYHKPVMVAEVLEGLDIGERKKYIDATVGGGGHGIEIVHRGGRLLGIDQDPEALAFAKQKMEDGGWKIEKNWKLVHGNFRDIEKIANEHGFDEADGILFDLGVSSHQIDTPDRGFSFRYDQALLDLRMDPGQKVSAREYIHKLSEEELYEIFATYGEEQLARAIAVAVVRARRIGPITTVGDLTRTVNGVVKDTGSRMRTLARIFQALRIAVNDELAALKAALRSTVVVLKPGGRLVVVSYHSLEDRIVKREIERLGFQAINKRPFTPGEVERAMNTRSRSAKLRIAEKYKL